MAVPGHQIPVFQECVSNMNHEEDTGLDVSSSRVVGMNTDIP